jgi:hypothetical protein
MTLPRLPFLGPGRQTCVTLPKLDNPLAPRFLICETELKVIRKVGFIIRQLVGYVGYAGFITDTPYT